MGGGLTLERPKGVLRYLRGLAKGIGGMAGKRILIHVDEGVEKQKQKQKPKP